MSKIAFAGIAVTSTELQGTPELVEKIMQIVADEAMIDRAAIASESRLDELNIQSADYVMILMAIEEKFGIYISVDGELTDAKTVGDLIDIVARKIEAAAAGQPA